MRRRRSWGSACQPYIRGISASSNCDHLKKDTEILVPAEGESPNQDDKYTRVQVRVDSKVRSVEQGESQPTGQFHFTFNIDKNIRVMPRTYTEYMMYIDARRRAKRVSESLQGEATDILKLDPMESLTE